MNPRGTFINLNPKLSIITSVFDGDEFIEGFLRDIVRQTYFDRCELLLVNADSPGHELRVINPYLFRYRNIRYFRLDYDPGIYAVWNFAIGQSRGEYLSNANIDDRKHPSHLERHAKILDDDPDIDLVYADVIETMHSNETFENCTRYRIMQFSEFSYLNLLRYNMPHCNPVWRKSMHDRYGHFRDDMISAADFEFWLRAASCGSQFQGIPEPLSLYYRNPNGISTRTIDSPAVVAEVMQLKCDYDPTSINLNAQGR